jgi:hypothetical protein
VAGCGSLIFEEGLFEILRRSITASPLVLSVLHRKCHHIIYGIGVAKEHNESVDAQGDPAAFGEAGY